ncbi:hypothetical protein [Leptothermofonsia sp. ETS-13]|uniref:hypothetical protein n=1 Tax=Leptothermofonsia sp. ETS-13 TaxID=3035696 RepID=UPI003BA170E0
MSYSRQTKDGVQAWTPWLGAQPPHSLKTNVLSNLATTMDPTSPLFTSSLFYQMAVSARLL